MGGYWETLFYEDDSSWTSALSNVCTTIVNYGVEIPWCVCATSSSALTAATEYATMAALTVYTFLGMESWWCCEYTVAVAFFFANLPYLLYRSKGNRLAAISMLAYFYGAFFLLGTMYELFAGLQGGVVFGGKLFYPTLAMFAVVCQMIKLEFQVLENDIYGYLARKEDDKVERFDKPMGLFRCSLMNHAVLFMAVATFGLPKLEADTDPATWLFMIPLLAMYKEFFNYVGITKPAATECKEANGDVVAEKKVEEKKEEKKAEPAKKEEPKKDDKKAAPAAAADAKKDEETKTETEVAKKEPALAGVRNLACAVVDRCRRAVGCVACAGHCAYSRVAALPWDAITNVFFTLGINFTIAFMFWSLTEDPVALALPVFTLLLPKAARKYESKLGADCSAVLLNFNFLALQSAQYYLFKSNITQAY